MYRDNCRLPSCQARRDCSKSTPHAASNAHTSAVASRLACVTDMPSNKDVRTIAAQIVTATIAEVLGMARTRMSGARSGDACDDSRQEIVRFAAFEQRIGCERNAVAKGGQCD